MSLFELRVKSLVAAIGRGKALKTNAIAEDGFDYAVKSMADHPRLPFTEWFCYQLAQTVALSCPATAVLILPDGNRAFGSRIQPGLVEMEEVTKAGMAPEVFLEGCAGRLSAAYALDLFVANIDRHFGNFLFATNSLGVRTAMPIDYSHAWWIGGWPLKEIHDKDNPTTIHMSILRGLGLWKAPDALIALGNISQVLQSSIENWLAQMPLEWLSESDKASLVTWWGGEDFHGRVSKCVKACQP